MGTRDTVARYWATAEARDWEEFGALLAEDVVYDIPQTRERISGRTAYLQFNIDYPGDWHVEVVRIVAEDHQAASWIRFRVDGHQQDAQTFFRFDASGQITSVTDFWPEPYEPPTGREHLTERY